MTFAPPTILAVRALLKGEDADLSDVEVGIVGGPGHILTGTSYHLGADQLKMYKNPYSVRTARDKAGLSNASSALDVDDDLDELREMSVWVVEECRRDAPDTRDFREIIYSPDGVQVLQWDRERGVSSVPQPHSDLSHRGHSHFGWYRDSEFRDKTGVFRRFFDSRRPYEQEKKGMVFIQIKGKPEVYVSGDNKTYRHVRMYSAFDAARKAGVPHVYVANLEELEDLVGKPQGTETPELPTAAAVAAEIIKQLQK